MQIGLETSILSLPLENIQNIEFPNSLPFTVIETAIVLNVNYLIVLIIYDLINNPLLVPVNLDTVQLFTKHKLNLISLLIYGAGHSYEPPGLKLAYSHRFSSLLSWLVKSYFNMFPLETNNYLYYPILLHGFKVFLVPLIKVLSLKTKWI